MHRSIPDAGVTVAFGTDIPASGPDPLEGIHQAITRCNFDSTPISSNPEERIILGEELKAYTYGSACAIHREK